MVQQSSLRIPGVLDDMAAQAFPDPLQLGSGTAQDATDDSEHLQPQGKIRTVPGG
ncbi:MAG: hypothetical protein ABIO34_10315 [Arthrobacter oryzae]